MTRSKLLITGALVAVLTCGGLLLAQAPQLNIDPHRHGNLAAAQSYILQAYQRIETAQQDNREHLGGHAQKAKELLSQADAELRLAADVANSEHR